MSLLLDKTMVCLHNKIYGITLLVAGFVLVARPGAALGQGFDAERFVPGTSTSSTLSVERAAAPRHLDWGLGLFFDFADDAVVERDRNSGMVLSRTVDSAVTADLIGAIGLFGPAELGIHLPVQLVYGGEDPFMGAAFSASGGVGDLGVVPKLVLFQRGSAAFNLNLGLAVPFTLPTGDDLALRGAGGVTAEPRLLIGLGSNRWAVNASAGYRWRSQKPATVPVGNELAFALGGSYFLSQKLGIEAELLLGRQVALESSSGSGGVATPAELLGAASYAVTDTATAFAGAGLGTTNGLGSPDFRVFVGLRYRKRAMRNNGFGDSDGDGIIDKDDECPDQPEDLDGFEDNDGCPEPDNDNDGIADDEDECPVMPEEKNGDGDGCPDKTRVTYVDGKLNIFGKVQFDTGSSRVSHKSDDLLNQLAAVLKANPQVERVEIQGHTDNVGGTSVNQKLSDARARSVKDELVKRGVANDRLDARGYGETKPRAPNRTRAGRAKNRRVEFVIKEKRR